MAATPRSSRFGLVLAIAVVVAAWGLLYSHRRAAHQPNVDDYLYASTSREIYRAWSHGPRQGMHAVLTTGRTAPLIPVLAAPLARLSGVEGAVGVNLPMLVVLTLGAYLLARRWVAPTVSAVIAVLTALTPAVLGWSQMLSFSVATTAACLWTLAAYLHSDGFQRWRWSITTGVALGILALSRTIAPVYIAPFLIVAGTRSFLGRGRLHLRSSWPQIASAAVFAALVAGPWWARSGKDALHYLRTAGYDSGSGFNTGSHGLAASLIDRTLWTLGDLGFVSVAAFVMLTVSAVAVLIQRRRLGPDAAAAVGWTVGCFGILATSSNHGTGFGLPVLAVVVVGVGVVVSRISVPVRAGILAAAAIVTVVGYAGELSGELAPIVAGPIYRAQVRQSGADEDTNVDLLHRQVGHLVGRNAVLVPRDDAAFNANGLGWAVDGRAVLLIPSYGPDGTASALQLLASAQFVVTGTSQDPYHTFMDEDAIEAAARRAGFVLVSTWRLGPRAEVRLWHRS